MEQSSLGVGHLRTTVEALSKENVVAGLVVLVRAGFHAPETT
jgi:hypothetical protein